MTRNEEKKLCWSSQQKQREDAVAVRRSLPVHPMFIRQTVLYSKKVLYCYCNKTNILFRAFPPFFKIHLSLFSFGGRKIYVSHNNDQNRKEVVSTCLAFCCCNRTQIRCRSQSIYPECTLNCLHGSRLVLPRHGTWHAKSNLLQALQEKFSTIIENTIPSTDHSQEQLWTLHNVTSIMLKMTQWSTRNTCTVH